MSATTPKRAATLLGSVVALAAALGGSGCGSAVSTVDPVAEAAVATAHAGGAHLALSGTVNSPLLGAPMTLAGSGAFNFRTGEGTYEMTASGLPEEAQTALHASTLQLSEVLEAGSIYVTSPLLEGKLPGGARWVKVDLAGVEQSMGLDPSSLTSGSDPTQYLRDLLEVGTGVRVVGHEAIRGVPTTRYAGSVDLVEAAAAQARAGDRAQARAAMERLVARTGSASMPVEAWVDAHGLLRRLSLDVSERTAGQPLTVDVVEELFDFGPTATITAPSGSEVFDATSSALQGLGGG